MKWTDDQPSGVVCELGRYRAQAAETAGIGGLAPGTPSADAQARVIPFPARKGGHGELGRLPRAAALVGDGLELGALPEALRADQEREAADEVGAAMLALRVSDYRSLEISHGRETAEGLLGLFERRLREALRGDDQVVRVADSEFLVVLEPAGSRERVAEVAQRILARCTGLFALDGARVNLGAKLGIALQPADAGESAELVRCARIALREAEAEPASAWRFFSQELAERMRDRLWVSAELGEAIGAGRLVVHYQPQYELKSGRLVGFEALVRLRSGAGELLPPARFIEIAEHTGLVVPLGRWVLNEACRQLKRWRALGQVDLGMAINVSPRQLREPDFLATVEQALTQAGLEPGDIELEITEGQMVAHLPRVQQTLRALSERGVRLAVDDFGTGYSSFAYLAQLPVHTVKLDGSLIADLPGSRRTGQMLRGLVRLIGRLGLRLIAEGVETEAQQQFLRHTGCALGQGFALGYPQGAVQAKQLLCSN